MARMPDEIAVKVRAELDTAVVVRPGDKLVLGFARSLTMKEADTIRERVTERLPGVGVVIIDNVAHMAVYRDEPAGTPSADPSQPQVTA